MHNAAQPPADLSILSSGEISTRHDHESEEQAQQPPRTTHWGLQQHVHGILLHAQDQHRGLPGRSDYSRDRQQELAHPAEREHRPHRPRRSQPGERADQVAQ